MVCDLSLIRMGSARHDRDPLLTAGRQAANIPRVAGENPVSRSGDQRDSGIDGIIRARPCEQHARIAAHLFIDATYIHRSQESGDARLLASGLAPDLRDHDGTLTTVGRGFWPILCAASPLSRSILR